MREHFLTRHAAGVREQERGVQAAGSANGLEAHGCVAQRFADRHLRNER